MSEDTGTKLIKLKLKTYNELTALGKKTDTYDDIIQMLLKFYKDKK